MSLTLISARTDTSDHGLSQSVKGPGYVANGLTGIKNVLVKCLFIFNWG